MMDKLYQNRIKSAQRWQAKVNSPEYREKQQAKEQVRRARQAEKARIKREEKLEELKRNGGNPKVTFVSERLSEVVSNSRKKKATSLKRKPTSKKSSRGTKGRSHTAEEKRMEDKLAKLPCICCSLLQEGGLIPSGINLEGDTQYNEVSLHHIDGRTKPLAHFKQLPLCGWHHQNAIPPELRDHPHYQYLVPVHADGIWGGKAQFNALFESEQRLLEECYARIGERDFFSACLS
ncbi:hypothetical protein NTE19_003316 [Vibrio fluvialis]|nr:hypothetical protein [Vibrio fluvialis]